MIKLNYFKIKFNFYIRNVIEIINYDNRIEIEKCEYDQNNLD